MKVLFIVVGILLLVDYAHTKKTAIKDFGRSLRKFAGSMYYTVAKGVNETENIFFSPLSITETLGMVMAGSAGNTLRQLEDTLEVNEKRNYTLTNYNNLFKKIYNKIFNTSRGNTVSTALMASRMFVQQQYPVKESYKSELQTYFDAEAISTNFGDAAGAAKIINQWVANKTENLITDLMNPETIDALTRIVLVNALFFKATWKNKMYSKGYEQRPFHTAAGEDKTVDFIGQNAFIQSDDHAEFNLEQYVIPYVNDEAHLIIIMPKNDAAMEKFAGNVRNLTSYLKDLPKKRKDWASNKMYFSMPKFAVDATLDMTQILKKMGVKDLFDPSKADLSGISTEKLYVGVFTHKAKVIVDEQGTVAAAATAAGAFARSISPPKISINRPFLFAIYRDDHLLFFGRVSDPDPSQK